MQQASLYSVWSRLSASTMLCGVCLFALTPSDSIADNTSCLSGLSGLANTEHFPLDNARLPKTTLYVPSKNLRGGVGPTILPVAGGELYKSGIVNPKDVERFRFEYGSDAYVMDPPSSVKREIILKRREEEILTALQAQMPQSSFHKIGLGGESIIFERVSPFRPNNWALAIPIDPTLDGSEKRYAASKTIVSKAFEVDQTGAQYLVKILGAFGLREPNRPFPTKSLVMRLAPLGSLQRNLSKLGTQFPPREMLRLWKEIALGVRSLHRQGVVHRDIKPGNILVWKDGNEKLHPMISDFGLSVRLSELRETPPEILFSGTMTHMREDALAGKPPVFGHDLYALRLTYMEMLMGQTIYSLNPRDPDNHIELRSVQLHGRKTCLYALPKKVASEVHPYLRMLINHTFDDIDAVIRAIELTEKRFK